jgi:hypothetical protein
MLLKRSTELSQWTGIQTHPHRSAVQIADILGSREISGHVATLFPIVVLDANQALPEFATGSSFLVRTAIPPSTSRERAAWARPRWIVSSLHRRSRPSWRASASCDSQFMDTALIEHARRAHLY